jgi:hypothetical protein
MGKKRAEIGDRTEAMAKMVELAAEATALATIFTNGSLRTLNRCAGRLVFTKDILATIAK